MLCNVAPPQKLFIVFYYQSLLTGKNMKQPGYDRNAAQVLYNCCLNTSLN